MNSLQFGELSSDPVFLLGGHDLEMAEIKQILEEHRVRYYDYNLVWGACLSAFRNIINTKNRFKLYWGFQTRTHGENIS